jgi:hypothetical protein
MNRSTVMSIVLGTSMLAAAWCTKAITPTVKIADSRAPIVLASAIPERFGDWEVDRSQVAAVVNPTTVAELNKIYAETLSRTYVNRSGARIMLSIAYGNDQRDNLAVHFPEGCYGGQGFAVDRTVQGVLPTAAGNIPVSRTEARLNKKAKLSYAFHGLIPDATLMRVSNVTADREEGYRMQEQFVNQMLAAMNPSLRDHFAGVGH